MCLSKKEVAMKFTPLIHEEKAKREYEIYTYLNAIDNPIVEEYGIPSVYYYDTWKTYTLIVITLFDPGFELRVRFGRINNLDLLIMCREFVSDDDARTLTKKCVSIKIDSHFMFSKFLEGENNEVYSWSWRSSQ